MARGEKDENTHSRSIPQNETICSINFSYEKVFKRASYKKFAKLSRFA